MASRDLERGRVAFIGGSDNGEETMRNLGTKGQSLSAKGPHFGTRRRRARCGIGGWLVVTLLMTWALPARATATANPTKLTASHGHAQAKFGISVVVSGDTVVV